ncbi:MAG: hypothetical protein AAF711_10070 [Planctomycetota bacterium]
MSSLLRVTLLGDGPTDRALQFVIEWAINQIDLPSTLNYLISFGSRNRISGNNLSEQLQEIIRLFPCEILCIHRDSEQADLWDVRATEIDRACDGIDLPNTVKIIPVRMTESWFLSDTQAIRAAAGKPNGTARLSRPNLNRIENLARAKERLEELLRDASESNGRRRKKFNKEIVWRRVRVAEMIEDFSYLRQFNAYQHFEQELVQSIKEHIELA